MSEYRALGAGGAFFARFIALRPSKLHHRHPHAATPATVNDLPFEAGDYPGAFEWLDGHSGERGAFGVASKVLGVSVNTLKARYAVRYSGPTRKGPAPRLGTEVENVLVDWIKLAHQTACSVPMEVLRSKAREIARKLGIDEDSVGGVTWLTLFFGRHKELSVRQSQLIGVERLVSLNPEAVTRYFDILDIASQGVAPGDKWIMDETNVELRGGSGKVSDKGVVCGGGYVYILSPLPRRMHSLTFPPTLLPLRRLSLCAVRARCTSHPRTSSATTCRCSCARRRTDAGSRP